MPTTPDPLHRVLWTSGWDSTFRVADLAITHGRTVEPWYVIEPDRRSTPIELRRLRELRGRITALARDRGGRVLEPVIRRLEDLPPDPEVQAAAERIGAVRPLGAQHSWLPLLVRSEGLTDLELGWENDFLANFVPMPEFSRHPGGPPDDWYYLEPGRPTPDRYVLWGSFRFPIIDLTKREMAARAEQRGFSSVMTRTWTCRWPTVFGRPCGLCMPCTETRIAGLGHRVPRATRTRQALRDARFAGDRARVRLRSGAGAVADRLGRGRP